MRSRTLSELSKLTGTKPRTIQFWTTSGVLQPEKGTEHGGPGVHRVYPIYEVMIACIIAEISRFNFQIGALKTISSILRTARDVCILFNIKSVSEIEEFIDKSVVYNEKNNHDDLKFILGDMSDDEKKDSHVITMINIYLYMLYGVNSICRPRMYISVREDGSFYFSASVEEKPGEHDVSVDVDNSSYLTINLYSVLPKAAS